VTRAQVGSLYILLGKELEEVDSVPAGNVLGIQGLDSLVLKSATLSSSPWCPPFIPSLQSSLPILRVALEPALSSDLAKLERGLHLLNQADAHCEVYLSEAGEHLLVTAGEVHLQRCLLDLTQTYAKCQLNVSEPIVSFRETIVRPPDMDMVNEAIEKTAGEEEESLDEVTLETPNKQCKLTIKALPLPADLGKLLEDHGDVLKALDRKGTALPVASREKLVEIRKHISAEFDKDPIFKGMVDRIINFGPRRYGPNILIDCTDKISSSVWPTCEANKEESEEWSLSDYKSSICQGFQLACMSGPLCEEQLMGVAFIILDFSVLPEGEDGWGPLSGQIVSSMKDCCRRAFILQPVRLMTAMYSCDIAVKAEVLGKMYTVLHKRRGRVVAEEMVEGSSTFSVTACLPVIESINFGAELRKQTSGLAMPQLVFSHWEVIDIDPNWEPSTAEELLHFGEKADSENPARRYLNIIRRRKGLKIDEKLVEFAEKQRTLTKSK